MNAPLTDIFLYLLGFCFFVVLQALAINGVKEALTGSALKDDINHKINYQGNILYMMAPKFFEKYKYRSWSKPLYSCIRCMASLWGALTYWPLVILLFGFNWVEMIVFAWDVFILVTLNYWVYKKL
jgi:hypothetical protein